MWPLSLLCDPTWRPLTAALLHFVWQGAAIAAVWMLLFRLLRDCRCQTQYLLGVAGLLAMTACPVITCILLQPEVIAQSSVVRPHPNPLPKGEGTVVTACKPVGQAARGSDRPAAPNPGAAASWRQFMVGSVEVSQPYLLSGWLLGTVILGGRLVHGAANARRLRRGRRPIPDELSERVALLAQRLGFGEPPGVFISDVVREALVTGLLRPMVLLPTAWLLDMTPDVLDAVIAHELAHIRRFDLWVNLFQRLVETVLFYHPAVWWLSRRVRLAREMCCDELAVVATGQRVVYATALEQAAQWRLAPAGPLLGVAMGATRMTLLSRVRNVLGLPDGERKGRWWPILMLLLVLVVIGSAVAVTGHRTYKAVAVLRVEMQDKPIAFGAEAQPFDRDRFEIYKSTQQQIITGRYVLAAVMQKPRVRELASVAQERTVGNPVDWLSRRVTVSFPGKAEIMEIAVYADQPQDAATLADAVVDTYFEKVVDAEQGQKRRRLGELDRAYVEKECEVRGKRDDLKKLAETLGASDTEGLTTKQKLALEVLNLHRQEQARVQFDLGRLRSDLRSQQAQLKKIDGVVLDPEVEMAIAADPIARQLFTELGWRKLDMVHKEATGEKSDNAKPYEKDLQTVQLQYDTRRAELANVLREKKRAGARQEVERTEATIAVLAEQLQEQQKVTDGLQKEAERFGSSTVDIEMLKAEIKNTESVLAAIAAEREKLKVEVKAVPRITAPFGKANVPETPVWW
jgi:beta-lactamase regulating signal transducer with metallopeptidase domain